jgi:hypothetical protein
VAERGQRHLVLVLALALLMTARLRQSDPSLSSLKYTEAFAAGALLLSCVGLTLELIYWDQPGPAASLLKFYWFRLADFAVPMAVALDLTALIVVGLLHHQSVSALLLVATLAFSGWNLATTAYSRLGNPIPPADRKMRDVAAWIDVCAWIRQHTATNARFLTPRAAHTFKWRSGRAEVVTQKDIPQNAAGVVEWDRRLRAIHEMIVDGQPEMARSLGHLGTRRLRQLATQFRFDYVVTDGRQPVALPVVYENDVYVVYRVDRPAVHNSQSDHLHQ